MIRTTVTIMTEVFHSFHQSPRQMVRQVLNIRRPWLAAYPSLFVSSWYYITVCDGPV